MTAEQIDAASELVERAGAHIATLALAERALLETTIRAALPALQEPERHAPEVRARALASLADVLDAVGVPAPATAGAVYGSGVYGEGG